MRQAREVSVQGEVEIAVRKGGSVSRQWMRQVECKRSQAEVKAGSGKNVSGSRQR